MTSLFERWEKDPLFPAAEEVQESADGMESTYRTLLHALKEPSAWKTEELRRDLRTALGTTKWQRPWRAMTSLFERWEKDPLFPAAEEVQESADGMESTYRTLLHALKEPSAWKTEELRRDLRTALGTTKWQLEEFERAVELSYGKSFSDNAKTRHGDMIWHNRACHKKPRKQT